MQRLHFKIVIRADREKVWKMMFDDASYRLWTAAFCEGSYFRGEWTTGSKILFLAPGQSGESGIVSHVRESCPYDRVLLGHLGLVENGIEDRTSDAVRAWVGAQENYYFLEHPDGTELRIETDVTEQDRLMLEELWPGALQRLKGLCESA